MDEHKRLFHAGPRSKITFHAQQEDMLTGLFGDLFHAAIKQVKSLPEFSGKQFAFEPDVVRDDSDLLHPLMVAT